jgi:hypothetical protein
MAQSNDGVPGVFTVYGEYVPGGPERVGEHLGPRSKQQYPYSYDPLLVYRRYAKLPAETHAVYSDRLRQWDFDKFRALSRTHFGNEGDSFHSRKPAKIEAFLREWFEQPELQLVRVEEHCNVSNGFPVWVFWYRNKEG